MSFRKNMHKYLPIILLWTNIIAEYFSFHAAANLLWRFIIGPIMLILLVTTYYSLRNFITRRRTYKKRDKIIFTWYIIIILYSIYSIIKPFIQTPFYPLQSRFIFITVMLSFGMLFIFQDPYILKRYFRLWFKYIFLIFIFISIPFYGGCNIMLAMIPLFSIFIKLIPLKKQWIIYFSIILAVFFPAQRIQLVVILIPLIIILLFERFNLKCYKTIIYFFISIPFISLLLYAYTEFNILDFQSYIKTNKIEYGKENLMNDTRTFLYLEAFESSINNDYWLLGRSYAYGYDTTFRIKEEILDKIGVGQRVSEVFAINIYTSMGIIGIIAFTIFFLYSSLKPIRMSQNKYLKILGVMLSLMWVISWISYNNCRLNPMLNCMIIILGMVHSPVLLSMNNHQFELYIKSIYYKR